jgi:hypothetical protein
MAAIRSISSHKGLQIYHNTESQWLYKENCNTYNSLVFLYGFYVLN